MTDYTVSSGVTTGGYTLYTGDNLYVSSGGIVSNVTLAGGDEFISSGGLDSGGAAISQGGEQDVYGSAVGGVVLSGGIQLVESGGVALYVTVYSSGSVLVDAQGLLSGATVSGSAVIDGQAVNVGVEAGALETIGSGGTTTGNAVTSGAREIVESGAVATGTHVLPGGEQEVYGSAVDALVIGVVSPSGDFGPRGDQEIESGGVAISTTVAGGGYDTVQSGGMASDTLVESYGSQLLNSGGAAFDTVVLRGGFEEVASGASASGTVLMGGDQTVNGAAFGTIVDRAGDQDVEGAGVASGTVVNSGGEQRVEGSAVDTTVNSGGVQYDFGATSNTSVNQGGSELVDSGSASGTVVSGGGLLVLDKFGDGGTGTGTVILSGGHELVRRGGVESGAIISGGLLELKDGATGAAGSIGFAGTGGTLQIDNHPPSGSMLTDAVISGFVSGDTIDLANITYHPGGSATLEAGNVLDIHENGQSFSLQLDPSQDFSGEYFHLTDPPAGTEIIVNGSPPCFTADVRILTERGEVRVAELRLGDRVVTVSGALQPIVWIGRQTVSTKDRRPEAVLPVRIKAGALGDNVPVRDLVVSPGHAVHLGGRLVPARHLVNGSTVVREAAAAAIDYWHIELPEHGVVIADGAPAESYLDVGNRDSMRTLDHVDAHLRDASIAAEPCFPMLEAGPELVALRERLFARAAAAGLALTDDPDLRLVVDGETQRPTRRDAQHYSFALKAAAKEIRIVSRANAPIEVKPAATDTRRLGVALEAIVLRTAGLTLRIAPSDHPGLEDGFHASEKGHRWTTGDARLPAAVTALIGEQGGEIELRLASTAMRYVADAPAEPEPATIPAVA